jgi:hypothetical protein
MEWMPRLIGMGIDGQSRSFDVMATGEPDDFGDFLDLGDRARQGNRLNGGIFRRGLKCDSQGASSFGACANRVDFGFVF